MWWASSSQYLRKIWRSQFWISRIWSFTACSAFRPYGLVEYQSLNWSSDWLGISGAHYVLGLVMRAYRWLVFQFENTLMWRIYINQWLYSVVEIAACWVISLQYNWFCYRQTESMQKVWTMSAGDWVVEKWLQFISPYSGVVLDLLTPNSSFIVKTGCVVHIYMSLWEGQLPQIMEVCIIISIWDRRIVYD